METQNHRQVLGRLPARRVRPPTWPSAGCCVPTRPEASGSVCVRTWLCYKMGLWSDVPQDRTFRRPAGPDRWLGARPPLSGDTRRDWVRGSCYLGWKARRAARRPQPPGRPGPPCLRQRAVGGSSRSLGAGGWTDTCPCSWASFPTQLKGRPSQCLPHTPRPSAEPAPQTPGLVAAHAITAEPVAPGFRSGQSCRSPSCSRKPPRSPLGQDRHADPLGHRLTLCPARPSPSCYRVVAQTPWGGRPAPGPQVSRSGSEICLRLGHWVRRCNLLLGPSGHTPRRLLGACPVPGTPHSPTHRPALSPRPSSSPAAPRAASMGVPRPPPPRPGQQGPRGPPPAPSEGSASWRVLRPPLLPGAALSTASLL